MSQRLHIGKTEKEFYDCVIESSDGAEEKLKKDWLCLNEFFFLSPWKIRIADKDLFRKIEPILDQVITDLGKNYPEDVNSFYYGEEYLPSPSKEELGAWLQAN